MKIIVVEDISGFNKKIEKIVDQVLTEEGLNINILTYLQYNNELRNIIHSKEIKYIF